MKRTTATALFILILLVAKLSEPSKEKAAPPEHELIYLEGDRIIAEEGFMDLTREEREELIQKL